MPYTAPTEALISAYNAENAKTLTANNLVKTKLAELEAACQAAQVQLGATIQARTAAHRAIVGESNGINDPLPHQVLQPTAGGITNTDDRRAAELFRALANSLSSDALASRIKHV